MSSPVDVRGKHLADSAPAKQTSFNMHFASLRLLNKPHFSLHKLNEMPVLLTLQVQTKSVRAGRPLTIKQRCPRTSDLFESRVAKEKKNKFWRACAALAEYGERLLVAACQERVGERARFSGLRPTPPRGHEIHPPRSAVVSMVSFLRVAPKK